MDNIIEFIHIHIHILILILFYFILLYLFHIYVHFIFHLYTFRIKLFLTIFNIFSLQFYLHIFVYELILGTFPVCFEFHNCFFPSKIGYQPSFIPDFIFIFDISPKYLRLYIDSSLSPQSFLHFTVHNPFPTLK